MPLPPDVQILGSGDATRLILPKRMVSGSRWAGCAPIIFGLIFGGFAVFWILGASGILEDAPPPLPAGPEAPPLPPAQPAFDWTRILFALFGIPFVIAGCVPIILGFMALLPSHAEILITAGELIAVNQIGPFRVRQRRPIGQIGKLRVGVLFEKSAGSRVAAENHAIYAESIVPDGQPLPPDLRLAQRYKVEMLAPVAQYLLDELKRRGTILQFSAASAAPAAPQAPLALTIDPDPVPAADSAVDAGAGSPVEEPELPQPEKSQITFLPESDSLTFMVPRTGFNGTAKFFLIFSLIWDGISFPFFGFMLFQLVQEPSFENLGVVAFLSLFVAIGIATALAAIQSAFRKSVLLATRDALVLTQTGPLRKSEFQWNPAELVAIRSGNSNTTINGKVLQELQILTKTGPAQRAFAGRADEELLWLAAALRRFYQVKSE